MAAAVFVLMFGVLLSPWVIRNYLAFHSFVPFTTGMGRVLIGSYNDDTVKNNPGGWNEYTLEGLRASRKRINEVEEDALKRKQGMLFLRNVTIHQWVELITWKFLRLWFPAQRVIRSQEEIVNLKKVFSEGRSILRQRGFLINIAATLLFLPVYLFFWVELVRRMRGPHFNELVLLLFIYVNMIALVFWGSLRFRYVFEPMIIILGCSFIVDQLLSRKEYVRMI
jgi:hypothetical protein